MADNFILNFTLYNDDAAKAGSPAFLESKQVDEDCLVGPQRLSARGPHQ